MVVIGHRGAAALAPENTLQSFEAALSLGVDAIETDVRETFDGELILIHDKRLDRTTDGTGAVRNTPWQVIRTLDAGSWFSDAFRGARVPLLREGLVRYGQLTHWALEIKSRGIERKLVELILELNLTKSVTITSFHFDALLRVKRAAPHVRAGYLSSDVSDFNIGRCVESGLSEFCPRARNVTPHLVSKCNSLGLSVRAWGVSTKELMRVALDAGVDGMTLDDPRWLLDASADARD